MHYFQNGFLLMIPILAWNLLFYKRISDIYSFTTPSKYELAEKITRIITFLMSAFMCFSLDSDMSIIGLAIYITGLILYFGSWLIVIYNRKKYPVFQHIIVRLAPAWLPIIWLIGIGLMCPFNYFNIPFLSEIFIGISLLFVIIHTLHTYKIMR